VDSYWTLRQVCSGSLTLVDSLTLSATRTLCRQSDAFEDLNLTKDPFFRSIERHWRDHRPKMVAALQQAGRLDAAIETAANRTAAAESAAFRNGTPAPEAMEMFRDQWAFLPSENDEPDLPAERNPLTGRR
jgi:hypothetical protein